MIGVILTYIINNLISKELTLILHFRIPCEISVSWLSLYLLTNRKECHDTLQY